MKQVKIKFTDNFLNTFDGDQEELDAIIEELTQKFTQGEFEEYLEHTDEFTVGIGLDDMSEQKPRILH